MTNLFETIDLDEIFPPCDETWSQEKDDEIRAYNEAVMYEWDSLITCGYGSGGVFF